MYNKMSKKLLACAIATCASLMASTSAERGENTNLTQVNLSPIYSDAYMPLGDFCSMANEVSSDEDACGGCFRVTGIWQQNTNCDRGAKALGAGFGVGGKNSFAIGNSSSATDQTGILQDDANRVPVQYLIHTCQPAGVVGPADQTAYADLELKAKVRRLAAIVSYKQSLNKFYEGLSFSLHLTGMNVRTQLEAAFTNQRLASSTNGAAKNSLSIENFFKGAIGSDAGADKANGNGQNALTHGKIHGDSQSDSFFQDARAELALNLVDNDNANLNAGVLAIVPFGKEQTCTYLFEPASGSSRNFRVGGKLFGTVNLVDGEDYSVKLHGHAMWNYAFKREGKRLYASTQWNMGHYHLGYQMTSTATAGLMLDPLVNILPRDFKIKPGNTFDAAALVSLSKGNFVFDLQYHFNYAQKEDNELSSKASAASSTTSSTVGQYVVAAPLLNTSTASKSTNPPAANGTLVDMNNFTSNVGNAISHTLRANVGFTCKDCTYPAGVGVFGGYKFTNSKQRTPQHWELGVQGGVCF